ncbi:uncharacterized protein [Argopecten irradians]|uniref:uncharacterized protein n=1 Tax=Argopecten irradians TaxID=31199 RepID=UPI00371EC676
MMGSPLVLILLVFGCFQVMNSMPTLEKELLVDEIESDIELLKRRRNNGQHSSEEEEEDDEGSLPLSPSGFRYIRGPKNKGDRIVIVGAGPSGVHMALKLKEEGYSNVVVFEAEEEVGGKSRTLTYRDTPHEMGTCYTQADYTELYRLLDKYDAGELRDLPSPTIWTRNQDRLTSLQFTVLPAALSLPPGSSQEDIMNEFTTAVGKYIAKHFELFGQFEGELMPRPTDTILQNELNMTFMEFLIRNDADILANFFLQTQTTQGYGHLDEVPALYGLTWMTPNMILNTLFPPKDEITTLKLLSRGYQTVWKSIVEQENIDVRLSSPVRKIIRRKKRQVKRKNLSPFVIEYDDDMANERKRETADFIVLTPQMKMLSDMDIIKFNDEEENFFSRMNHYYYTTSLVDTKALNETVRGYSPQSYFSDNIQSKVDGSIWVKRDSFNSLEYVLGENYTNFQTPGAPDGRYEQTSVYYQYSKGRPDKDVLEKQLRDHIENREGAEVLNILRVMVWDYFPQFSVADIATGITWDIFDMQGKYGIWYAGSSVYFESAKSVLEYNNLIFRQFASPSSP